MVLQNVDYMNELRYMVLTLQELDAIEIHGIEIIHQRALEVLWSYMLLPQQAQLTIGPQYAIKSKWSKNELHGFDSSPTICMYIMCISVVALKIHISQSTKALLDAVGQAQVLLESLSLLDLPLQSGVRVDDPGGAALQDHREAFVESEWLTQKREHVVDLAAVERRLVNTTTRHALIELG